MVSGKFAQFGFPTVVYGNGGGGGSSCLTDAAEFAGADASIRIQAAIDSLPATGGVIDCRCFTGAQSFSQTVTIDKPVQLLFGAATFTCTASPAFHFPHGADPEPGPGTGGGTILEGAGTNVTKFILAAGSVGFLIQGDFVLVGGFGVEFSGDDAANIGIDCRWETPTTPHGLLRPFIDNVFLIGGGVLGKGINISVTFGGEIARSQIYGFAAGVYVADDGANSSTTVVLNNNRIHSCVDGVYIANGLGLRLHDNIIEGNSIAGLHIIDGQDIKSTSDYYEQPGAENVIVEAAPDAFPRVHYIVDGTHGGAPGPYSVHLKAGSTPTQTVYVMGGSGNLGMNAEGSGRIVCDGYQSYNDNNAGNVIEIAPRFSIAPTKYRVVAPTTQEYAFQGWSQVSVDTTFVWQPTGNASFYFRSFTDINLMVVDGVNNTVAIGTTGSIFGRFTVADTATSTAGATTKINVYSAYTITPSGASASDFAAVMGDAVAGGSFDVTGAVYGTRGDAYWTSTTKTLSHLRGAAGRVVNSTSGVVVEAYGLYSRVLNFLSGQITNAAGLLVDAPSNNAGAGGTIPNYYGVIVYKPSDYTGFTNTYGMFLDDFSGGTAALWVNAGLSHFGGMIRVGGESIGLAGTVSYTNTVNNAANSSGVGTIKMKGSTSRDSSGFLKILDGTTPRYVAYFDDITG